MFDWVLNTPLQICFLFSNLYILLHYFRRNCKILQELRNHWTKNIWKKIKLKNQKNKKKKNFSDY